MILENKEVLNTTVIVDSKEPTKIHDFFVFQSSTNRKYEDLKIVRSSLKCGDFKFNSLGAERKEIMDFIGSIHDGRVFRQIFNMNETYTHKYLLVSGDLQLLDNKDLKAIYTTCADFDLRYGVKVVFFPSDEILVHYFLMLCKKLLTELKPIWVFHSKSPDLKDEQIEVLCGIYKCGEKTAIRLLEHFKTLYNVFKANIDQLIKVKGVGKKMAEHIYDVSNLEYKK